MFERKSDILNFNPENLLLVSQKDDDKITETERKILYAAESDYHADAVFFLKENHKSIPQFFIYDNTNSLKNKYKEVTKEEIHKRLWSSQIVPLYFIYNQDKIEIINARRKIDNSKENEEKIFVDETISIEDTLKVSNKIEKSFYEKLRPYSKYLFENGTFWDTEIAKDKYLNNDITKESPFDILIENLHDLKKILIQKSVNEEIANRIVIFCILIKYLEEKKDDIGNSVFVNDKANIFQKKWKVSDFSELIKIGKFTELLNYLSEKFNGKIFELSEGEEKAIKNFHNNILIEISDFLNAQKKVANNNYFIWKLYSFRYLPVELISRIYEEFMPDSKGAVYTPPFLVDFLIDECIPLEDYKKFETEKFKIIDPASGSGIFCVSAFKRLLDWKVINDYQKSNRKHWNTKFELETLKKILQDNIFGVDLQPQAVQIAIFSLTIAMLEKLTPLQLWDDLDFDDTNTKKDKKFEALKDRNIFHCDFFKYLRNADKDFDLVIGNPPFIRGNFEGYKKPEFNLDFPYNIPKNLSVLFLDQSIKLLKDNGLQCLILQSSSILYNDGTMNYRKQFMQNYHVPQIVDFTHLRRHLFNKDVATCAFFVKKEIPNDKSQTLHLISNRTTKEENKTFFSFDTYNFHFVTQKQALTQKYIWKANLVGGGRLKWIVDRLSRIKPTLGEFLEEMKKNDWFYQQGYINGNKTKFADYITNNYFIPEKAFSMDGIDYSLIEIETETKFKDISNKKVFTIPQVLIKKGISNNVIPIELIDYNELRKYTKSKYEFKNILCFRHGIVGIHYKEHDFDKANQFFYYFKNIENNKLFCLFIYLSSGTTIVNKEGVIEKKNIDYLPYPQTEDDKLDLQLSEVEKIWQDDVFEYYIHQAKASKNNPLNTEIFFQAKENTKDKKFIADYAETFVWLMNINYTANKEKSFKTRKITVTQSYIAVEFHYTNENLKPEYEFNKSEEEYQDYFTTETGNKKITRIVQYIDYPNNKIYFIKPRQKRYWLKSIADRDGMSCFADFSNNKYQKV